MSTSPPPARRRFLPEPVETTTKSSRKFKIEPLETSVRTSKARNEENKSEITKPLETPPKRRFLPQPVETSTKTNRVKPAPEPTPDSSPQTPPSSVEESTPQPRRRFTPQLIETTKRSKRAGDTRPATLPTDKTDITPGTNHIYQPRRRLKQRPVVSSTDDHTPQGTEFQTEDIPSLPHRQGSMRPNPTTRRSTRQDSFQPELEPILSSDDNSDNMEGDDQFEETPSLSGSFGSSEDSVMRLQLARTRESCDDRFSGYLLALAAKAAEKQLREQALAAFPNSDFHEVVEHFYDREVEPGSDDEDAVGIGLLPHEMVGVRRQSTEVGWAAREMQQHQEALTRLREDGTAHKIAVDPTKQPFNDPFWTNGITVKSPLSEMQKEAHLMRNAASPPMLGSDLKFRRCPSPKATKFETDQPAEINLHHREDGGGLWGGYCVAEEKSQFLSPTIRRPTMIQTPSNEREDPFANEFGSETSGNRSRPGSSSKAGVHMLSGIDERLHAEANKSKIDHVIQEEFDDDFVTQVYNYLSLGYPSLARHYDEELSKITKISVEELSNEDNQKNVLGHVGLVPGTKTQMTGAEQRCPRWKALRVYILEWAKQHPSMGNEATNLNAWGVRARRGSWAI